MFYWGRHQIGHISVTRVSQLFLRARLAVTIAYLSHEAFPVLYRSRWIDQKKPVGEGQLSEQYSLLSYPLSRGTDVTLSPDTNMPSL